MTWPVYAKDLKSDSNPLTTLFYQNAILSIWKNASALSAEAASVDVQCVGGGRSSSRLS